MPASDLFLCSWQGTYRCLPGRSIAEWVGRFIDGTGGPGGGGPGEAVEQGPAPGGQALTQRRVGGQAAEGAGQAGGIAGWDEEGAAPVLQVLGEDRDVAGHHR